MGRDGNSGSQIEVTAMVIGTQPIGEYERRVVLLTREKGKISAFARGARRQNSSLLASTDLFAFGNFRMYASRSSYTLTEANVQNPFAYFRTHMEASLLGQYFCEVLDYCTRENNDEAQLLLLLYQTLRAMESERFSLQLVRSVFELKTVVIEGELEVPHREAWLPATMAALEHIIRSDVGRLYSFRLDDAAQEELARLSGLEISRAFEHHRFRSSEILEAMGL